MKVPSNNFHGNPSSEGRADTCGQADGRKNGMTDMTKVIVAFNN